MVFSYSQISSYLACPRRYRYQYLEGWQERATRAAMLFGRAFEQALAAYFRDEDASAVLLQEWSAARCNPLEYGRGESWEQMWQQGVQLLELFAQQERVRILHPERDLQVKILRRIDSANDFISYIDALGELDGKRSVIDWKTSASCYVSEPDGLASLDPQLICYSWMSGIAEVALVVFVRKRVPEIQYLHATITSAQREEFGELVRHTVQQVGGGHFAAHPGIRFPQTQCLSCPYNGLCLQSQELIARRLERAKGADLGWLDELCA